MNILFSPEAEVDFAELIGHLVRDDRVAAASGLGQRIFAVLDKLARGEFEGPRATLRSGRVVCSWPVPPIRIYYDRKPVALLVVRLHHASRAPITR